MTTRVGSLGPVFSLIFAVSLSAQTVPPYLQDRGTGIPASMFGTYVRPGELVFYPFYEYTLQNAEYKPSELGYGVAEDFIGHFREHEAQVFIGYGVNDRLLLEFESALWTTATLRKDPSDPSALPPTLRESGFGDTQAELRWRWTSETASRPEVFSYLEADFPFQKSRKIIGTQTWATKLGAGAVKGFSFGTVTGRADVEWDQADGKVIFGEYAVEYLKRLSDTWRFYTGVEGFQDEVEYIVEFQRRLGPRATLKLNNSFGVTSKAPKWAPEIGIMFSW
jgi:hypothetical protein